MGPLPFARSFREQYFLLIAISLLGTQHYSNCSIACFVCFGVGNGGGFAITWSFTLMEEFLVRVYKSSVVRILLVNFIKVIKEDDIGNKCSMHGI